MVLSIWEGVYACCIVCVCVCVALHQLSASVIACDLQTGKGHLCVRECVHAGLFVCRMLVFVCVCVFVD